MKKVYNYLIKTLFCIMLFLVLGIICKNNVVYKEYIYNKIYNDSISFSYFRQFYNKYFGGIFPIDNIFNDKLINVFNSDIYYLSKIDYEDGVKLMVDNAYLVPSMDDGIVTYIGEKNKYGNVVILENSDGIYVWYGNLCNVSVNLYDNVIAGDYLGEACDDFIYLVYSKGNDYLDYRSYFQ